jgi:hypothetical protein
VRLPLRIASTLLIAVGVATCSDTPPVAVKHSSLGPNGAAAGRVAFQPVFSAAALQIAQGLSDFGIKYDRVRVVLVRPVADTAKDTTIAFTPGGPDITLNLTVDVRSPDEAFDVGIDYLSDPGIVFHGHGRVHSHAQDQPAPPDEQISIDYVGPGANVTRIAISPRTIIVPPDMAVGFVVAAFDANNSPVSTVPLRWTTSDPSLATITSTGSMHALGRRGNVVITAVTPTGVTDRVNAVVVPTPTSIALIDGGGQRGSVGTPLAAPAVVQVNAADGLGVPGVSVVFSAPVGGHVSVATVETDADGRASSALTLGTVAGQQLFGAGVGDLSTRIPETANPGAPALIAVVSGNGQTDTIHKSLAPLVVRLTDQFGNPIAGAVVSWARTSGAGSLTGTTSTTNTDGRATMTYTFGGVVGNEGVTASISGLASRAVFNFQALAAAPATIVAVSGNAQTARVGTPLGAPLVVKVADDAGSPVGGATVNWTATNGTIVRTSSTDADGQSSVVLTLGARAGSASATGTIANGQRVTFVATAQPGIAAIAVFSTQPTTARPGGTISAVRVALVDTSGNLTAAANNVSIALGRSSSGAVLSGTLVRKAVSGVATFSDLTIDKAGTGYTLVASSGNLAPVTSSPFNIDASFGAALTIVAGDNQRAATGSPVPVAPSVRATDANGNPVAGVSVTFSPSDGGAVLPSGAILTDGSGLATLTSWTMGPHAGPQTLTASTPGQTSVVLQASAFGGPPAMLVMATQPSATATSGVLLDRQPVVQLQDHFGNPVAAGSLTITVTASSGSLLGTTSIAADPVTGMGTFADLGVLGSGVVTLTFSAPGVQSVTSSSIMVSGGASTTTETTGVRF